MCNAKYVIEAHTKNNRLIVFTSTNMRGCFYYLKNNNGLFTDLRLYEIKEAKELPLEMISLTLKNY